MRISKYRYLYLSLFLVSLVSALVAYYYTTLLPGSGEKPEEAVVIPPIKQQVIHAGTSVYLREQYALCSKYNLGCDTEKLIDGAARNEFNNMTYTELEAKYPESANWKIKWELNKIVIEKIQPGLCPEHKERWHLEPDETGEKVAAYVGPVEVGKEGGLVHKTDIMLSSLPLEIQDKIRAGKLEFINWEELIATLDSLDEYNE